MTTKQQLEEEIGAAIEGRLVAPLERWAVVRYRHGNGRRLTARLFDNKKLAEQGVTPDSVLVRVQVTPVAVYR